jgi:DNA/RNA-binding protein KIN17
MGKRAEKGTPKDIANRAKAKGLQKLKFYCQICEKQCRDANGFKCHCTSEAHLRQMEIFGMNQGKFIGSYSEEFKRAFLNMMATSHRNSRVSANIVYNEYIAHKEHIHMNATRWTTLTEFIKHLGREGICEVDETPKGWFLTYRPEDKEEKMRQAMKAKRKVAEEEEDDRNARLIREQIERANAALPEHAKRHAEATELDENAKGELKLSLAGVKRIKTAEELDRAKPLPTALEAFNRASQVASDAAAGLIKAQAAKKPSALDEIFQKGVAAKEAAKAKPVDAPAAGKDVPWLQPGVVVKIVSKALQSEGLYKKKGAVRRCLQGGYVAEIDVIDTGARVQVDQTELETVLPSVGGAVVVLKGEHRGLTGKMDGLETDKYVAVVTLREGPNKGATVRFDYEDISKLSSR